MSLQLLLSFYPLLIVSSVYNNSRENLNFMAIKNSRNSKFFSKKHRKLPSIENVDDSILKTANDDLLHSSNKIHVPKTKYGMCIGYLGTNYFGFQKQITFGDKVEETVETVEGALEKSLIKIGAIDKSFIHRLQMLEWSKAARTDKGVHAACMVVGCRMSITDDFLEIFNKNLPNDITCYDVFRVTKGFDARSLCSYRNYEYLFPGYLLGKFNIPSEHKEMYDMCCKMVDKCANCPKSSCFNRPLDFEVFENPPKILSSSDTNYQVSNSDILQLEGIFQEFIGSHNFHNFSSRISPLNPASYRYINSIKVSKISSIDNFVRVSIQGHSFLLNQIRKMIGIAIEVFRGSAPKDTIKYGLNKLHSIHVNTAPAQGLFLHHPNFDNYNSHRAAPPFTKHILYEDIQGKAQEFISQQIYPEILKYDKWHEWLETINEFPFYFENPIHKLVNIPSDNKKILTNDNLETDCIKHNGLRDDFDIK